MESGEVHLSGMVTQRGPKGIAYLPDLPGLAEALLEEYGSEFGTLSHSSVTTSLEIFFLIYLVPPYIAAIATTSGRLSRWKAFSLFLGVGLP